MRLAVSCLVILLSAYLPVLGNTPGVLFREIDLPALEMTHHPLGSTASAVVLYDYRKSHFSYTPATGLQIVFVRHTRIKILTSDGYDGANAHVNLYHQGRHDEAISHVKGYPYHLDRRRTPSKFVHRSP